MPKNCVLKWWLIIIIIINNNNNYYYYYNKVLYNHNHKRVIIIKTTIVLSVIKAHQANPFNNNKVLNKLAQNKIVVIIKIII